jgi:transposase InsO family protein
MRDLGLESCQPSPWRFSLTEGDGREHGIPDRVQRDFTAGAPGEKLVGDITYIPTWQGWLYLRLPGRPARSATRPGIECAARSHPGLCAGQPV